MIQIEKLTKFLSEGFNLIRVYYYIGIPTKRIWDKNKETEEEFENKLTKQRKFLEPYNSNETESYKYLQISSSI